MGHDARQVHRFSCVRCGEDMAVALNVDFEKIAHWVEAVENAEHTDQAEDAPTINLDANFLIPEEERHLDRAFPRLGQLLAMTKLAEARGSLATVPFEDLIQGKYDFRPYRRLDFGDEWRLLKKAWSLHRRAQGPLLVQKRILSATEQFYKNDPLDSLQDWLWRFTLFMSQPSFENKFQAAFEVIRPVLHLPSFIGFVDCYSEMIEVRAERYFELIKGYFDAYDDFSQVYLSVVQGLDVPDDNIVASINFDTTRMFYGNAFEAFASSVDILAYLSNLKAGRSFDQFENLTREQYLKLDKANRFEAVASVREFVLISEERDNQIRNASHHGGMRLERSTQKIRFRTGKGGTGPEQKIGYAKYLARSTKLFLQAMTLLRLELIMSRVTGMPTLL
jgi:hypothetical protein